MPPTSATEPRIRPRHPWERALDRCADSLRAGPLQWGAAILMLAALITSVPQADPDLFARVAVGRLVEATGRVVDQDPFAFTERLDRWIDHEWLTGVVLYRVARLGGDQGLALLNLSMMALTVVLAGVAQRLHARERQGTFLWLVLTLVPAVGVWVSVVRSRVFTFVFLPLLLLALVLWREGRTRWLWLLPPGFAVWANMHGGFVAGLGLLGAAAVAVTLTERRRSPALWLCLAACVAATLLNPYGLEYWRYLAGAVTMERPYIVEWTGLPVLSARGVLAVLYLGLFVLGGRLGRRRPPPEAWAVVAATFLATLSSRRLFNWYLVTLAVYGTPSFGALLAPLRQRWPTWWLAARRIGAVAVVATLAWCAALTAGHARSIVAHGLDYDGYPMDAIHWLEARGGGGDLLLHFDYGSLALWRLHPLYRVAVDGRYEEVYPQETVDRVFAALIPDREGHDAALAGLDPDYILVRGDGRGFPARYRVAHRSGDYTVLEAPDATRPRRPRERAERPMWDPGF